MVRGDGGGSAGHAGVGQAGDSMKFTFPHKPAKVTSRLSTSSRKSQAFFEEDDLEEFGQPQSTLRTRQERVGAQRESARGPAWAAGRQAIFTHLIRCVLIATAGEVFDMLMSSDPAPRPRPHPAPPQCI
jgi:hypothetical protein